MSDGLTQLTEKREQRKRSIPPSRNAPREAPVSIGAVDEPTAEQPEQAAARPVRTVAAAAPRPAPTQGLAEDLAKYSIYFDAQSDEFMEAARTAGRRARPKVDASRSAVARLAIARLAEAMTPEQVVAELQRRAPAASGTGRKRL